MSQATYSTLAWDVDDDGILVLRLDRPDQLNSFTVEMADELVDAFYRAAADALDCAPHEVLMVAAHSSDLDAAARAGLRTAHIARPDEHGPGRGEAAPSVPVDVSAADLGALADQLLR